MTGSPASGFLKNRQERRLAGGGSGAQCPFEFPFVKARRIGLPIKSKK